MLTTKHKVGRFATLLSFISALFMTVFADEQPTATTDPQTTTPPATPPAATTPPTTDPTPSGTVNFEDLIAKARKDEKDKLYPEIEKHKTRANEFLVVIAERDASIKALQEEVAKALLEIETLKKAGTGASTSAEASATISTLERSIEVMKDTHQAEINRLSLDLYKQQKFAEVGVANFLPELVSGSTQAEIDASIEASKARLASIQQSVLGNTRLPVANPNSATSTLSIEKSAQEIADMTPQAYATYRNELMAAGVIKN